MKGIKLFNVEVMMEFWSGNFSLYGCDCIVNFFYIVDDMDYLLFFLNIGIYFYW